MAHPSVLDKLSNVKFTLLENPSQHPNATENATEPQISNIRRVHKEQFEEYLQCDLVDKALKSLFIAAVDE